MRYQEKSLKIYNSLSGAKEIFKPVHEGRVGMYVCGPTVYSNVHLGNVRTFVSFDLIFRYLKHLGYKVRYVRNITDVGHLENDADTGEDRIAKKARLEQVEPMEVAQRYTVDFRSVMQQFNCLPPSIEPTATGHILEQIQLIEKILQKGYAYVVNGSVYFDVFAFNQSHRYGKLSGRSLEELIHNTRELSAQTEKKNPQDFALWKKAEPQHIMRWKSPWSDGFPGWHLECTAMSTKYLGETFDIHGGGMDLKFPHHECEIAQSESCTERAPVNYWIHANMLTLNGKKMAKSTGNNILPNEIVTGNNTLLDKPYSPAVVRFFMLQAHYSSVLDFSSAALTASEKGYYRLMEALQLLDEITPAAVDTLNIQDWKQSCYDAMNDDFNSPILIAQLFEAVKYIHQLKEKTETLTVASLNLFKETLQAFVYEVLGLTAPDNEQANSGKLNSVVELLLQLRTQARENKDWATSDTIRDQLAAIGIQLKDGKEKTTFTIGW